MSSPGEIIDFWFAEAGVDKWWNKDNDFDRLVSKRFLDTYEKASSCELFEWRQQALGWLAEIIVLDQFPRNMFRGEARAFATDAMAVIHNVTSTPAANDAA